jgi:hypothetical protein
MYRQSRHPRHSRRSSRARAVKTCCPSLHVFEPQCGCGLDACRDIIAGSDRQPVKQLGDEYCGTTRELPSATQQTGHGLACSSMRTCERKEYSASREKGRSWRLRGLLIRSQPSQTAQTCQLWHGPQHSPRTSPPAPRSYMFELEGAWIHHSGSYQKSDSRLHSSEAQRLPSHTGTYVPFNPADHSASPLNLAPASVARPYLPPCPTHDFPH